MGGESDRDADVAAESAPACLLLVAEGEVRERCLQFLEMSDVRVLADCPSSLGELRAFVRHTLPAFVLAHGSDLTSALARWAVRSVSFPPVLLLSPARLAADSREQVRRQGVSWVFEGDLARGCDEAVLASFAGSPNWFRGQLENMQLTDALQVLIHGRRGALVTISCGHVRELSPIGWESVHGCDDKLIGCAGWTGRLYVREGELVHAETPRARGLEALAQMIQLRHGTLRIHEHHMEPAEQTLFGSVQNNILNAAVLVDDLQRDASVARPSQAATASIEASEPNAESHPSGGNRRSAPPLPPAERLAAPPRRLSTPPPPFRRTDPGAAAGDARPASHPPPLPQASVARAPSPVATVVAHAAPPQVSRTTLPVAHLAQRSTPGQPPASPRKSNGGQVPMGVLDTLLSQVPGALGAARADSQGNVLAVAGQVDAETVCAVVHMSRPSLDRVAEALGLGALVAWTAANARTSLCVRSGGRGAIAVVCAPTRAPEGAMKKLEAAQTEA